MHPTLMAELGQERHATMLRNAEAHRLAQSASAQTRRAFAARPRQLSTHIHALRRRLATLGHPSVSACCA